MAKGNQMRIVAKLSECRAIYEWHYNQELPGDLPFIEALKMVAREIGLEAVANKLDEMRRAA